MRVGELAAIAVVLCTLGATSSGCARVAAYERGKLAHPTMAPDHGLSPGREHMQAVHEGAAGGERAPASGCGCN